MMENCSRFQDSLDVLASLAHSFVHFVKINKGQNALLLQ